MFRKQATQVRSCSQNLCEFYLRSLVFGLFWDLTYFALLSNICNDPYKQSNVKSCSKCNSTQRKDAYLSSTTTDLKKMLM